MSTEDREYLENEARRAGFGYWVDRVAELEADLEECKRKMAREGFCEDCWTSTHNKAGTCLYCLLEAENASLSSMVQSGQVALQGERALRIAADVCRALESENANKP